MSIQINNEMAREMTKDTLMDFTPSMGGAYNIDNELYLIIYMHFRNGHLPVRAKDLTAIYIDQLAEALTNEH